MVHESDNHPLSADHADSLQSIREVLAHADYTEARVLERLGISELLGLRTNDFPRFLQRTNRETPLDTLIRLFLLCMPADRDAAGRAIAPMKLEEWIAAGLLRLENGSAAALVELLPYKGLILATDLLRPGETVTERNFVMGIGRSTLTLANATIRRHSRMTLDIGAGCGIQAFLAADHSERVIAADRSLRACNFTAFNTRLNGFNNIQCLCGDLAGAVQGPQFDLIVSNPPYVITPDSRYLFRDSGMQGDRFCQRIIKEAPKLLSEGGFCQILCDWAHYSGQDWQQRLCQWFEGTGCDVWVMRCGTTEVSDYAAAWVGATEERTPSRFGELHDRWVAYYRREGIEAIGSGLITLRRASNRRNWIRLDDAPETMRGPCGQAILSGFVLRDFLEISDDQTLLDTPLCVSPDVRWEQAYEPSAGKWQIVSSQLQLVQGLTYTGKIDPYGASLIGRCDGKRTLRELLTDMSGALEVTLDKLVPATLEVVRRLIEQGFVLPGSLAP